MLGAVSGVCTEEGFDFLGGNSLLRSGRLLGRCKSVVILGFLGRGNSAWCFDRALILGRIILGMRFSDKEITVNEFFSIYFIVVDPIHQVGCDLQEA